MSRFQRGTRDADMKRAKRARKRRTTWTWESEGGEGEGSGNGMTYSHPFTSLLSVLSARADVLPPPSFSLFSPSPGSMLARSRFTRGGGVLMTVQICIQLIKSTHHDHSLVPHSLVTPEQPSGPHFFLQYHLPPSPVYPAKTRSCTPSFETVGQFSRK